MELDPGIPVFAWHAVELSLVIMEIDGNISVFSNGFKYKSMHISKNHVNGFLR